MPVNVGQKQKTLRQNFHSLLASGLFYQPGFFRRSTITDPELGLLDIGDILRHCISIFCGENAVDT